MIDYLSRPAPSRITPWPGNPGNEMCDRTSEMQQLGANNGRKGKTLKAFYKGKEYEFSSIREASETMNLGSKSLGRNVANKTVPQIDGIEWIEVDGQRYHKKKVVYNHRKIKAVIYDEVIIFDKVVDAMDFFMVTRVTIHSWIKAGCQRDNGLTYLGYEE